jgi:hypothetical protein
MPYPTQNYPIPMIYMFSSKILWAISSPISPKSFETSNINMPVLIPFLSIWCPNGNQENPMQYRYICNFYDNYRINVIFSKNFPNLCRDTRPNERDYA